MVSETKVSGPRTRLVARASIAEYAVYGLFFLTGPIVYFVENAMEALVPLLALAAVAAFRPSWRRDIAPFVGRHALVLTFAVVGTASALWSLDAALSFWRGLRLLLELTIGLIFLAAVRSLDARARSMATVAVALGMAVAVVAAFGQLAVDWLAAKPVPKLDMASRAFAQGISMHVIVFLPVFLALWQRRQRGIAWVFAIATLMALVLIDNLAARLAFALALTVCGMVAVEPRLRYGLYAAVITAFIALPLAFPVTLAPDASCALLKASPSAAHRLVIWNSIHDPIAERPVIGWGLESSRILADRLGTFDLSNWCAKGAIQWRPGLVKQRLPLHPHNAALQVWLELGALGAVIVVSVLVTTLMRVDPTWRERGERGGFVGALAALFCVLFLSYGLLQGWLVASLFVIVGSLMIAQDSEPVDA